MIGSLIKLALDARAVVIGVGVAVMAFGVWAFFKQPIDAYPDISAQTVTISTVFPGRAPEDVERQVTVPIEIAMLGVPRVDAVRSRTIFGLSVVQLTFEEGVDPYFARARVQERLASADLPDGVRADMAPLTNGFCEVFRYEVTSDGTLDLMELRTLQDRVIIPRLLRVQGVADVQNFGGLAKQFAITFSPGQLDRYRLTLNEVVDAIKTNNASAGGAALRQGSMAFVIKGAGSLETARQIESIFVKSVGGTPVYVKDVATVGVDAKVPSGIFAKNMVDETINGTVLQRRGENPSEVLKRVREAVEKINEGGDLPAGVKLVPFYDRQHLVDNTLHTVAHSVLLGVTLVVLVLLLFLGRPLMAGLVAITIPFSLLFALVLMYLTGIPIGLLSIGAIDFGIIVDGAIIMAEHIAKKLGHASHGGQKPDVPRIVLEAAREMARPVFFSILMIVVAYLPLLSLSSIEGLLFRPMALTMAYALGGALLFALFLVPVLATVLFYNGYHEWENPLLYVVRPLYGWSVRGLLACKWLVVGACICGMAFVVLRVAPRLGIEFLPYMDEGLIFVRANFPDGTALEQTAEFGRRLREIALSFEDVALITVQAGRNDANTDPYPPSRTELIIRPKPQESWRQFKRKAEMVAAIGKAFRSEFPTTRFNFTQPIIDGVTEDTNGTSANLAVEFSGPDSDVLLDLSRRTVKLLASVRGAQDVAIEQEGPSPQLVVTPDRQLCSRMNVRVKDVTELINTALGGDPVGVLYEGERRFDIAIKLDRRALTSPDAVGRLFVHNVEGQPVPLGAVATIEVRDGQTIIAREGGRRRITVRCDIVGRDQGGFVAEAQGKFKELEEEAKAKGTKVAWIGMFENLQRARNHFVYVLPVTVVLVFMLLLVTFGSVRAALLLLLSVPFGFIGGVLALQARGMNLNVSTGVGFAALFGVSIMNGVLLVRAITALRQEGRSIPEAILEGTQECLRPILLASLVAILGLLPASLATGLGSDVQRPLATVIVWGLVSSTVLTLFVVPVLYEVFAPGVPAAPKEPEFSA